MYFYSQVRSDRTGNWFTVGDQVQSLDAAWIQFEEFSPNSDDDDRRVVVYVNPIYPGNTSGDRLMN